MQTRADKVAEINKLMKTSKLLAVTTTVLGTIFCILCLYGALIG